MHPDDGSVSETDPPAVRPSDQLAELRKALFEARLEHHFGDDAARVFDKDGNIDIEALKKHFEEGGSDRTQEQYGQKYSPLTGFSTQQSPFFDIRA